MSSATIGAPPVVADETAALSYLADLYSTAEGGYLSLAEFRGPEPANVFWFPCSDLDGAARLITSAADEGRTIYAGMGLRTSSLPRGQRGGADSILGIPGIWADVDYRQPGAHAREDLPPDPGSALAIIREATPVPPTMIVESGFGFYPILLLREFWCFDDVAERERAAALLRRYNHALRIKAQDTHVDTTSDLSRVLKLPGSINWKIADDPRLVRVVHDGGPRFTVDELEEMLPQLEEGVRNETPPYVGSRGPLLTEELEEAIAVFAPWHRDGARHFSGVHVAGWCGKAGFEEADTDTVIERISVNDRNPADRRKAVRDTYARLRAGKSVSGRIGLRDAVGMDEASLARLEALRDRYWRRTGARINTEERDRARVRAKEVSTAIQAPAFPLDALPKAVRTYVTAAADSLGVPAEMVGMPIIGLAGAMVGNRVHLTLKNSWREFLTLYIAVVAPPGSAKTPALNLAKWPLDALQDRARDIYRERLDAFEAEMENWKQSGRERGEERPRKPELRHYFSTDLTVEALVSILGRSPGVAIVRDEIGGWVASMDQYRGGKGSDRQSYLQLWSGLTIKSDRKTGESIYARNPVACVVGGIQPDLAGDLHDSAKRRDGFVERVLPMVPDVGVAYWTDIAPTTEQYRGVLDVFELLDRLPFADRTSSGDLAAGINVNLTREAKATWVAWVNENAALAAEAEGLAAGFASKLPAHVARFALILHLLWNADDPRRLLNAQRMEDAIELGEFCRAHIRRFLALLMAAAPSTSAGVCARVMRIMRNANAEIDDGWVSRSAIYRGLRNVTPEQLTTALDELIESGVVEQDVVPGKTKPTQNYRIRISHYSQNQATNAGETPGEAQHTGESANTANNANGSEPEIIRVAKILQTFSPEDLAGFRLEVAAASGNDPDVAIDREALALLDVMRSPEAVAS